MAHHDFSCAACGIILRDINVPIAVGAPAAAAQMICKACGVGPIEWIPAIGRMDASNGPSFHEFETYDATNKKKIIVSSLGQLRKLEAESEVRARNGEGQHVVWPAYSNEPSNMDRHAIHNTWTDHLPVLPIGQRDLAHAARDPEIAKQWEAEVAKHEAAPVGE